MLSAGCATWTASISPASSLLRLSRVGLRNPSTISSSSLLRSYIPLPPSSNRSYSSTKPPPSETTTSNASPSSSSSGPAPDDLDRPSNSSSSNSDASTTSSLSSSAASASELGDASTGSAVSSSVPSYPSFASISSTHGPSSSLGLSTKPSYPDPTLPPIPQGVRKYQPLMTTLPLKSSDIYLAPTLDPQIQPPPHFPPAHPFYFLSIRDSLLPNKWRNNPLPPYPRPIVVPLFPAPALQPTDPRPADAPSTIRYQALQPEQMADLYDKRVARRARKDRQGNSWIQKMMDDWDREPEDPEGWQGVRLKLGLPPHARNRPPSVMYQWEAMEEEDLWKLVIPMLYVVLAVPIGGAFGMWAYSLVFNGRWEDEDGNFMFK